MHITQDGPSSENAPSFATLLKHYRRAAGLTQAELAEHADLSTKAISSLERGVNRYPRRETLQLLIAALQLDEEQRRLLEASRVVPNANTIAIADVRSHLTDSADGALQSHIAHLRTSKQHLALVDTLLVRAMIAMQENRWRAAIDDLDEALTLAQALPYPHAEFKALYLYGRLHEAMGACAKAREAYERALLTLAS
jgi:transcriptional regulator with XRE-family HTH domain